MKLTARALAGHKFKKEIEFDDDVAGFGIRCRDGKMSWIFQYAIGTGATKITRRVKIGDYPALSPATARAQAEDLHAKVHLHGDPAIERRKNRIEAGKTLGNLVRQYLEFKQGELRPRSFEEVQRHLGTNSAPLHNLPLASVDQAIIAGRLNAIAKDGGAVAANRTRASLSAMFVWAMGEGLAAANPVAHTNRREEKPRERVLTDAELRTVWRALEDDDYSVIVKLLLLTGQRKGEIAGLRWSEIDFKRGLISLPSERTKNAKPHDLPMSATVQALLQSRNRVDGRDMVFGAGDGPYSGWSKSKAALDARATGLKDWVLHDLRRSVATGMADIGIQPHIIEAVLNHVSGHKGGIAGIYNRATYAKEKAEALARWDAHIAAVVKETPSKVVGLRGRR